MKKLIFLFVLVALTATGFSQSAFKGFFKPVTPSELSIGTKDLTGPANVWKFRPAVEITATKLNWNTVTKSFDAVTLKSGGLGIGYQHYIEVEGQPYNNFGFNGLLLLGVTAENETDMSLALTVNALQFISVGAGYGFTQKKVFLLTGITYNF